MRIHRNDSSSARPSTAPERSNSSRRGEERLSDARAVRQPARLQRTDVQHEAILFNEQTSAGPTMGPLD
jgi:hypothetical protein